MSEGNGRERLRLHLETPDWTSQLTLSVPSEPAPIETWLPLLHTLANQAAQLASEAAERAGKRVSCKKGCGACCRQLVAISLVEAGALAKLVAAMPEPRQSEIRQRFARAARRFAEISAPERGDAGGEAAVDSPLIESDRSNLGAAWFSQQIACPFLENESCAIHESRPLVCREYQVTSPSEGCARLYRGPVEPIDISVRLGQSLARATAEIASIPVATIPIVMALEWSGKIEAALSSRHDAIRMLEILLGEIGDWRIEKAQ